MQNVNLSIFEVKDLMAKYQSELRKVAFEKARLEAAIRDLQALLQSGPSEDVIQAISNSTSSPITSSEEVPLEKASISIKDDNTIRELVNRKSKKRPSKGYRISDWDKLLLDSLAKSNDSVPIWILLEIFGRRNVEEGLGLTEEQVRGKLSRSLHKLGNKRGVIKKVPYEGKGFAYKLTSNLRTQSV